ncbi:hypothetical protein BD410DRAFT_782559 [Rickenella mellea]|uniref:Peptide N-acetyl-beta-D-glucosaminyl asparaginase amidase A N-terminal domain-containing protein n=1 Tax=Rickenella mellea TaxID=50990 RepID=A0A4Y7QJE9_9AGAM|nr:hypothetical protein BD410DRAFT_782559 [Rickenella mellea]
MRSSLLAALLLGVVGSHAVRLIDFQVAQPPPLPKDAKQCTIQILERTFGFSFGMSEVVAYAPPTDCGTPGSWAGISLNFTVTSNGTQFDRLALFSLDEVEIWRSSTPEPTRGDGIIWTYLKDVTRFIPLFSKPGTFVLQLDNLLEAGLDGQYATTLTATFFASSFIHPPAKKSNSIIPISLLSNTNASLISVPPDFSLNVTFPRNTVEAYAELFASGNGNEEFWYFNTANQFVSQLPAGTTFGQGPFREVRLLVDGRVAGVAFPYATIFTGGIIPSAWRPITSYGALDLPTYFLDLTPFVPILVDGQPHSLSLSVSSAEDDHTINQNWFVTAAIQVVTDSSSRPTTGSITKYDAQPFALTTTTGSAGANGDLNITVDATRSIHIESEIVSGSGKRNKVVWSQQLSYSNLQNYLQNTTIQNVFQSTTGSVLSTHNKIPAVVDKFSYPLNINFTVLNANGTSFSAFFDHSYDRTVLPAPFILGSTIKERQLAGGFFTIAATGNFGNGTSNNTLTYVDLAGNTYDREVNAALNNITFDHEGGSLARGTPRFPFFPKSTASISGAVRFPGLRLHGTKGEV